MKFSTLVCTAVLFLNVQANAAINAAPFTYEDLVSTIKANHLQSVEATLAFFPEAMRSNFTLVRNSSSLQGSDDLHPRVILFGNDARLTCAFGGSPALRGHDSLECYQFRADERRFDFREIVFPTTDNGLKEPAFSETNQQALGPFKCTSCHTQDPRPNWEPYSVWKAVYGGQDDGFQALSPKFLSATTAEKKAFNAFKASYKSSPRYSQLIFAKNTMAPYRNDSTQTDLHTRPNFRFTYHATQLTALRNARLLEQKDAGVRRKFLRVVADCPYATADDFFKNLYSLIEWTPAFRSLDPRCTDCLVDSFAASDLAIYRYNTGKGYLNEAVAYHLLKFMVGAGEISADVLKNSSTESRYEAGYEGLGTPVAPTVEPYKLRRYCTSL